MPGLPLVLVLPPTVVALSALLIASIMPTMGPPLLNFVFIRNVAFNAGPWNGIASGIGYRKGGPVMTKTSNPLIARNGAAEDKRYARCDPLVLRLLVAVEVLHLA